MTFDELVRKQKFSRFLFETRREEKKGKKMKMKMMMCCKKCFSSLVHRMRNYRLLAPSILYQYSSCIEYNSLISGNVILNSVQDKWKKANHASSHLVLVKEEEEEDEGKRRCHFLLAILFFLLLFIFQNSKSIDRQVEECVLCDLSTVFDNFFPLLLRLFRDDLNQYFGV